MEPVTYKVRPIRAYFNRRAYEGVVYGVAHDFLNPRRQVFFGDDGRKVRADAVAWCKLRLSPQWRPLRIVR